MIGIQGRPDWPSPWQTHKSMWTAMTLVEKLKLFGFKHIIAKPPTDKPSKPYSMRIDSQK
jgi:hypothetical protein